jgi:hypothetical protein
MRGMRGAQQDEVLEHPALFGADGVGASPALSNVGFGNPEELMHTLLLQGAHHLRSSSLFLPPISLFALRGA